MKEVPARLKWEMFLSGSRSQRSNADQSMVRRSLLKLCNFSATFRLYWKGKNEGWGLIETGNVAKVRRCLSAGKGTFSQSQDVFCFV